MNQTQIQTTVYLPNILLDETNYPTWFFRIESFLKGQDIYGYVDGSIPCPPQTIPDPAHADKMLPNPEYPIWTIKDQSIINMLSQTLSSIAMTSAVGSKSSADMWKRLKNKFAAPNRQNILQLKSNIQNLRKDSDSIEVFLDKIKAGRDALETVGVVMDDEDIVVIVLRGLPTEYAAIKTVIRAQFVSCSMGELKTLLKAAEIDVESEIQASSHLSNLSLSAMAATTGTHTPSPMTSSISNNSSPGNYSGNFSPSTSSGILPTPTPAQFPQIVSSYPAAQSPYFPMTQFQTLSHFQPYPLISNVPNYTQGYSPVAPVYSQGYFANKGRSNNVQGGRSGFKPPYQRNSLVICQLCNKPGHSARSCRSPGTSNDMECTVCHKTNHTADRCFFVIGFPPHYRSSPPIQTDMQAMLAHQNTASSSKYWLADTGATNHMTNDVNNVTNAQPYTSTDSVQVGDGKFLSITHSGDAKLGQTNTQGVIQRNE